MAIERLDERPDEPVHDRGTWVKRMPVAPIEGTVLLQRTPMPDPIDPLIADFLLWLTTTPRTHAEVMETWRTSCPHLPVWEEAEDRGLVTRDGANVAVTPQGRAFLAQQAGP